MCVGLNQSMINNQFTNNQCLVYGVSLKKNDLFETDHPVCDLNPIGKAC